MILGLLFFCSVSFPPLLSPILDNKRKYSFNAIGASIINDRLLSKGRPKERTNRAL